ncbi:DUF3307 domain-containing protein [Porphyromonadaceae bacterium W3.11]|nr:DUF3307 domain-containing protein [Porphyromonadaceae bacterium W3.11]
MNILVLIKLLLAHLISDFALQPNAICKGKRSTGKARFVWLGLHSLIHAAVAYLFVAQWDLWIIPVVIFASHFIIDYVKVMSRHDEISKFIYDQLLHLLVLVTLYATLFMSWDDITMLFQSLLNSVQFWVVLGAYLIILKPTSILISLFVKKWDSEGLQEENAEQSSPSSLPNAGKWIGYFERILTLTFILINFFAGVGFLLAAKSVFRFGDLNNPESRKNTEYVLIGTFLSFLIAIMIGVAVNYLIL